MRLRDGDPRRSARYQLYYRGMPKSGTTGVRRGHLLCRIDRWNHWTEPDLGLFNVGGTRRTTWCLRACRRSRITSARCSTPGKEVPAVPAIQGAGGTVASGLAAFVSEDGLRWCKLRDQPVLTKGEFDSRTSRSGPRPSMLIFAPARVARRCSPRGPGGFARLRHLDRAALMTYGDRPIEHLYTNQTSPYFRSPHLYIGIAARFFPGRQVLSGDEAGRSVSTRITFTTVLTRSS